MNMNFYYKGIRLFFVTLSCVLLFLGAGAQDTLLPPPVLESSTGAESTAKPMEPRPQIAMNPRQTTRRVGRRTDGVMVPLRNENRTGGRADAVDFSEAQVGPPGAENVTQSRPQARRV